MVRTFAHISDLHVGRDRATDAAASRLSAALAESSVDRVLLIGDVTHRGRLPELARFHAIFRPLLETGRLLLVPGNHDRLGDDVGSTWMRRRVEACTYPGLHVVRFDSTAPHNRRFLSPQGALTRLDVEAVHHELGAASSSVLRVLMLHHHVHPLPEDCLPERLSSLLGWRGADELALGRELVARIRGRCDLILHGHRHDEGELRPVADAPLRIINAGSTTERDRARVISHVGRTIVAERWLEFHPEAVRCGRRQAAVA